MVLAVCEKRFQMFGSEMDKELKQDVLANIRIARITLVEHNIAEALFLAANNTEKAPQAIIDINAQIKLTTQALDESGQPLIVPSKHLHPCIWRNAQKVIRGQTPT